MNRIIFVCLCIVPIFHWAVASPQPTRSHRYDSVEQQGTSKAELEITRQIRKGLMANKDLSMRAHNVKIITEGKHVFLRGPVASSEEQDLVGDIARKAIGKNIFIENNTFFPSKAKQ